MNKNQRPYRVTLEKKIWNKKKLILDKMTHFYDKYKFEFFI